VLLLAVNYRRRNEPAPPNNRLKLPFTVGFMLMSVGFVISGRWVITFAALFMLGIPQLAMILKGRNPWWMRAPIDYRHNRPR
jgi:hypothetical protein